MARENVREHSMDPAEGGPEVDTPQPRAESPDDASTGEQAGEKQASASSTTKTRSSS